jgi:serine/threonine protein kinase
MPFAPGYNVGPYRIMEQLGHGGMATVWKAYHPALDRYVAIKVLHPVFKDDEAFLARFRREAKIVAKLDHPNIVPIYDFSAEEGTPYLVMRYIEGQTLKLILSKERLSLERVMAIVRPTGKALAYAHAQGVLHRDIKPSNIIQTSKGEVFLTDFGLARMMSDVDTTLSRDMMVGTPQYISPEQARGEELDSCTDIYSVGIVLFEMLTGRVPFDADTPYAIIHDHIFSPLPLPSQYRPDMPEGLERAVLKALAKERKDRYQSMEEMMAVLEEAASGAGPLEAPPPPTVEVPQPKRRFPWLLASIGFGVLLLLLACCGLLLIRSGERWTPLGRALATAQANSQDVEAQMRLAALYVRENQTEKALQVYLNVLSLDPNNLDAHLKAGDSLFQKKDFATAAEHYEKAISLDPNLALPYARVAHFHYVRGDNEAAEREYLRALELDPGLMEAHLGLGLVYKAQGRTEEAKQEFSEVVSSQGPEWVIEEARRELDQLP